MRRNIIKYVVLYYFSWSLEHLKYSTWFAVKEKYSNIAMNGDHKNKNLPIK